MTGQEQAAAARAEGERGATLIEFALISTLMFTMLFGALSYGEVLADHVQLRHRLSEISRLVSLGEDAADRAQIFSDIKDDRLVGFMGIAGCAPSFTMTPGDGSGPNVTIDARYDFGVSGNCRVMPEIFTGILPRKVEATNSFTVND